MNTTEETINNDNKCSCQADTTIFLTCSGGSNCGQIANQLAIHLDRIGLGKMYCLAGIGAHIGGMVDSAKSAQRIVVIDGCKTSCAKMLTEHAGITITDYICITDIGIKKNHTFDIPTAQMSDVVDYATGILKK